MNLMKLSTSIIFLIGASVAHAGDVVFKACDNVNPNISVSISVHDSDLISFDSTGLNISHDLSQNLKVVMKLLVTKEELSSTMIEFYAEKGVTGIVSEMEYAAMPTLSQDAAPAFLINIMTLENNQMGINLGIQKFGGNKIDADAPITLTFVGSSANCR